MKANNVLIIGGNGFIGQNLANHLANSKCTHVSVFDRTSPLTTNPDVTYLTGDFFNNHDLWDALEGKDCVVHALSTINPSNSNAKYVQAYEKDVLQTIALCDNLRKRDIQLVFLSSGGTVYGEQTIFPIAESVNPLPINHYGCLKLCLENFMRVCNRQFGARFKIARVANPYGPGQDYRKGVGFIDAVLRSALEETELTVWGDGSIIRDYIHIDDVSRMLKTIIEYEGDYDTFNIGTGIGTSQVEIINIVKNLFPNMQVCFDKERSVDVKKTVLDISRILEINPHTPTNIKEGIISYSKHLTATKTDLKA